MTTTQQVGVRELLEAGVHFGHQAKRWNPKMHRYIFAERAGIHIIDLDQSITLLDRALSFVRDIAAADRDVMFVGTKKQAQLTLAEQAMRSGQPYVAERYIGGMLTNFQTIQPRIRYFVNLANRVEETPEEQRSGRDWFALNREYQKLRRNFAGLTTMERLPGALFVIDPKREELMVKEANRLRIPVIGLTDTNCDPEVVDYVIPGNDDAIRSINLIAKLVANAVLEGKGEDEVPAEDRPIPPAVEAALVSESVADQSSATEEDEVSASARASYVQDEAERPGGTGPLGGDPADVGGVQSAPAKPDSEVVAEQQADPEVGESEVPPIGEETSGEASEDSKTSETDGTDGAGVTDESGGTDESSEDGEENAGAEENEKG
ncbi:30S ribosomal protein S2 [Rubrobacter aplysinae]|uniref:30S ribosomal protein S2 n=1 Tax=Rubrobacter aplysinae TaxID=909625 RepID=UPI000A076519|nr:30S ribosomal protein S2 [Rubrobacter aplysinae]